MKALQNLKNNKAALYIAILLVAPFASFAAGAPSADEEAANAARWALIGQVGSGIALVVAVAWFLIAKAKQDKRERERDKKARSQPPPHHPHHPHGRRRAA
ncbi:MAG: hypothetical protein JST67_02260 [Bacteroidetes bacterium]|nr:hypothetical protein [Bacteroidota bacterium]